MMQVIAWRRLNWSSVATGTAVPSFSKTATVRGSGGVTMVVPAFSAMAGSGHASEQFRGAAPFLNVGERHARHQRNDELPFSEVQRFAHLFRLAGQHGQQHAVAGVDDGLVVCSDAHRFELLLQCLRLGGVARREHELRMATAAEAAHGRAANGADADDADGLGHQGAADAGGHEECDQ